MNKLERITTNSGNLVDVEVYTLENNNRIQQWQVRYCDLGDADIDMRECGKARPCIIVQTDKYNNDSEATIYVLPLSTSPMYNITAEKLIGIKIGNQVSILCFNELRSIQRKKIQNNIIADNIPDSVKDYIREYFIQRLFGSEGGGSTVQLEVIPSPGEQSSELTGSDARALSLLDWMIEHEFIINPQNINTGISITNCKYLYEYYEKMGIEPFKKTKAFNEKTFKLAMRQAKKRYEFSQASD